MIKISPSILTADFAQLGKEIKKLEDNKADFIHLDIMDGNFVPQITFGALMVKSIRPICSIELDVHLMINNPDAHLQSFIDAGSDIITVHAETCPNLRKTLSTIKDAGIKASVSIKPDTTLESIINILDIIDMVLVMTVEPGYGGQGLIESTLEKVAMLKQIKDENSYKYEIEVDGGINLKTNELAISSGATILVAGSAIIGKDNYADIISGLRGKNK